MSTNISAETLQQLSKHYQIGEITGIQAVYSGLDNMSFMLKSSAGQYFLQLSSTVLQPELYIHKASLLTWLANSGLNACIASIPAANGALHIQIDASLFGVLFPVHPQKRRYFEDENLDERAGTSLSEWISRLHNLTAKAPAFPGKPKPKIAEDFKTLKAAFPGFQKMAGVIPALPLDHDSKALVSDFIKKSNDYFDFLFKNDRVFVLLAGLSEYKTLVHNDLNLSNLSFDDSGQLEMVYDFDNAGFDYRVADLQFIYYYYYHPSSIPGADWFDIPKFKNAVDRYEALVEQKITGAEKQLCAMLGMDRSLRGLLWIFDMLSKGASPELLRGVDERVRPNNPDEPGSPGYHTLAKLVFGIERFSQIDYRSLA